MSLQRARHSVVLTTIDDRARAVALAQALVSERLADCGLLRADRMPEILVIPVEVGDPVGPYGAKGVGEIGLVATAAAVGNALAALDGRRRYDLPMRPGS